MHERDWQKDWWLAIDPDPLGINPALFNYTKYFETYCQLKVALQYWLQQVKKYKKYREMLEYVVDCIDFCPVCGQDKPGHKEGCELAALLSEPM